MRYLLMPLAALALTACGRSDSSGDEHAARDMAESAPAAAAPAPHGPSAKVEGMPTLAATAGGQSAPGQPVRLDTAAPSVIPTMLIRTGEASIEVRELDAAVAATRRLATGLGGFVGNTLVQGGRDEVRSATLELKIPAQRFDDAVGGLGGLGKVERVASTAQDVGEEYADVGARLANARRLEERLLDLLARRTGKLEEVLSVERELSRIREEIERMEGRMRYLRTRAAVSTLTITLHEPHPLVGEAGAHPITRAFRDAWRNFVGFIAGFIASLGVLIPLAALALGAWWVARRLGWSGRVPRRAHPPHGVPSHGAPPRDVPPREVPPRDPTA